MRKSAPVEVVVHYPETKEGWDELGKRVATAHANYVIEKIERLNCPTCATLPSHTTLRMTVRMAARFWGMVMSSTLSRNTVSS